MGRCQWQAGTIERFGHAVGVTFSCTKCHTRRRWLSSRILGGKYVVNQRYIIQWISNVGYVCFICAYSPQRMIHAFTAAGLLLQQYLSFCHMARLGIIGKRYIYQGKNNYSSLCTCVYIYICTCNPSYMNSIWRPTLLGGSSPGS